MKEQTGLTYQGSKYLKLLAVSKAKMGKTIFLVLGSLGLLPWQRRGGLVDKPSHLHVIGVDANSLGGVARAAKDHCGANDEALRYNVYNLQDDLRQIYASQVEYDLTFYHAFRNTMDKIQERVRKFPGVHAVIASSLTGIAEGLLRGIQGPVGQTTAGGAEKKGSGMDMSKWSTFASHVAEIRAIMQLDQWHAIWEGHLLKMERKGQNKKDEETSTSEETLQIPGKAGVNFPMNVEQILRITRALGQPYKNTKLDLMWFDTRPTLDFILGGRMVTEALDAKEYDLVAVAEKLGCEVGHWGRKKGEK